MERAKKRAELMRRCLEQERVKKDLLELPLMEAALRLRDAEQEGLRNEHPSHREKEIP